MRNKKLWIAKATTFAAAGVLMLAVSAQAQEAKQAYDKQCATCHGPAGKGDGPAAKMLKPPPQDFSTALKGMSDADIAKVIKEGGKAVGKSASMPGYGTKLSDDQIKALVALIKDMK